MNHKIWRGALASTTMLLAFSVLTGCNEESNAAQNSDTMNSATHEQQINVAISPVESGAFVSRLSLVGEVQSQTDALLACEVGARLLRVRADRGASVEKGDTLVVLDSRRYQAGFDAAQAQLENARLDFDMADRLYKQGQGISENDWRKASNSLKMAEAGLANARIDLENCFITAPFTGTIAERFVDTGELVSPGTPVMQLVQDGELKVRFGLPENQVGYGRKGDAVEIRVPEAGIDASGKITWAGNVLDGRSRTLPMEARITGNSRLKVGMACQVELLREHNASTVVVPVTIVQSAPDHHFLFIEENGLAVHRRVTLGDRDGSRVEITSGLKAGEHLITSGYRGLVDGQPLRVVAN